MEYGTIGWHDVIRLLHEQSYGTEWRCCCLELLYTLSHLSGGSFQYMLLGRRA